MADITATVGVVAPSKYHDNGDGTYSPAIYNVAGGAGVADRTVTIGLPAPTLYHDNGDGSFSPTIYLTGGSGGFTPDVATAGALIFSTAASKVVPGATSLSLRNHANTLDHLLVLDNGATSILPESSTATGTGKIQLGSLSQTQTVPDDTTSIHFIDIRQNFNAATGGAVSNSARLLRGDAHWTDATHDVATMAGGYFFASNDAVSDVQDLIGVIGRAYITSTGKSSVGMWGVRGDHNFTGAATGPVNSVAAVVGHQGDWSAAATITQVSQIEARDLNCTAGGATVVYGYGVNAAVPTNASSYNVGVNIGATPVATGPYTVGLNVNTNGAWFRGNATLPVHADTTTTQCIIALLAGSHAGANDTTNVIYFYRSSTALGYLGFDTNVAQVNAGRTKLLTDLVLGSDKCLVDGAGQIWSAGSLNGNSMSIVPTVKTSGTLSGAFTYTGAAHTGITAAAFAEFSFNAQRTVTFDGTGSPTVASGYTFNFLSPTYTASTAAFTITSAATLRVAGAPAVSAAGGFTPVLTTSWAVVVASGSSSFGGAIVQGHATAAINSTNTATAAQAATGYITSTSAATVTITLPTGTALGAALGAVQGTIHYLYIDNTAGANVVTVAVNTNAILSAAAAAVPGTFGLLTVPSGATGQACFKLMFSSATAYTITRIS